MTYSKNHYFGLDLETLSPVQQKLLKGEKLSFEEEEQLEKELGYLSEDDLSPEELAEIEKEAKQLAQKHKALAPQPYRPTQGQEQDPKEPSPNGSHQTITPELPFAPPAKGGTMRTCRRCGVTYGDRFFYHHKSGARKRIEPVCIGCQQHARDTKKRANRPRQKAKWAIGNYVRKYIKLGTVKTAEEFIKRFGWDLDQITHDIEHAYQNGCTYCHESISEMGNGLSGVTLDVVDPEALPIYGTNTNWVCRSCNSPEKLNPPKTPDLQMALGIGE